MSDQDTTSSAEGEQRDERSAEGEQRDERSAEGEQRDQRSAEGEASRRLKPMEAARRAAEQLAELRDKPVDGIAGFERLSDGWRVVVDLLEVSRVPPTTDVLGSYEVTVDGDGDLVHYERLQRYVRAQAGEQER